MTLAYRPSPSGGIGREPQAAFVKEVVGAGVSIDHIAGSTHSAVSAVTVLSERGLRDWTWVLARD